MQHYHYRIKVSNPDKIEIEIRNPLGEITENPQVDCLRSRIPCTVAKLAKKTTPFQPQEIKKLGESLYGALFPPSVDNIFRKLLLDVPQNEAVLHLELYLDNVPSISALPWEFMRAPQEERWAADDLAIHPKIVLLRRRTLWVPPSPVVST